MKQLSAIFSSLIFMLLLSACSSELKQNGQLFQKNRDYASLKRVVELMPIPTDTSTVKRILGEPINTTLDYRYIIDSIGPNGCPVGAVFMLDTNGIITGKWIDEICE